MGNIYPISRPGPYSRELPNPRRMENRPRRGPGPYSRELRSPRKKGSVMKKLTVEEVRDAVKVIQGHIVSGSDQNEDTLAYRVARKLEGSYWQKMNVQQDDIDKIAFDVSVKKEYIEVPEGVVWLYSSDQVSAKNIKLSSTVKCICEGCFKESDIMDVNTADCELETIEAEAFMNCKKFRHIHLKNPLRIGIMAFWGCSKLYLYVPKGSDYVEKDSFFDVRYLALYDEDHVTQSLVGPNSLYDIFEDYSKYGDLFDLAGRIMLLYDDMMPLPKEDVERYDILNILENEQRETVLDLITQINALDDSNDFYRLKIELLRFVKKEPLFKGLFVNDLELRL